MAQHLQKIQQQLLDSLLRPQARIDLSKEIRPGGQLNLDEALNVYRDGYFVRLTEALGEIFESVWWLVGDQHFFKLCHEYIENHPSKNWNLSALGLSFPQFINGSQLCDETPFLKDMAAFELLFHELFHMKIEAPIAQTEFLKFQSDPSRLFRFSNGSRVFTSQYQIYEIWKLRKDKEQNIPFYWKKPQHLILYRIEQDVFIKELKNFEFEWMESLRELHCLEKFIDKISSSKFATPENLSQFFSMLKQSQSIAGIV